MKVFLSKQKENGDKEFAAVYFNSKAKQQLVLNMVLVNLFKKFCIEYIVGLMKDLLRQLNIQMEKILLFLFIVHYQEVRILNYLIN